MKNSRTVFLVLTFFLSSLACNSVSLTTPTSPASQRNTEDSPTVLAPIHLPPATKTTSPVPPPMAISLPTPAYTIGPYTPPADWIRVNVGYVIYLPPEITILDSGESYFLADLPVAPGTDQVGKSLFLAVQRGSAPNCGVETAPDHALMVTSNNGFQYIFYRDYRQEVQDGHTFEFLAYWMYEYETCIYLELALESAFTGDNDAPLSAFVLQEEIDFLETILSTYYEEG